MPPTLKGIYHNLKESEYTVSNGDAVFFFSSKLYMNKFIETYKENREKALLRFSSYMDVSELNMETLSDISLYIKIEKRGFNVWLNGVTVNQKDLHLYALRKMTFKNTTDWCVIQKPKLRGRMKIITERT